MGVFRYAPHGVWQIGATHHHMGDVGSCCPLRTQEEPYTPRFRTKVYGLTMMAGDLNSIRCARVHHRPIHGRTRGYLLREVLRRKCGLRGRQNRDRGRVAFHRGCLRWVAGCEERQHGEQEGNLDDTSGYGCPPGDQGWARTTSPERRPRERLNSWALSPDLDTLGTGLAGRQSRQLAANVLRLQRQPLPLLPEGLRLLFEYTVLLS